MPRRRILFAAAVTSLLAGCGVKRPPAATRVGPDATYPDTPGAPGASGTTSAGPQPGAGPGPAGANGGSGRPSAGTGPDGAQRLTGSDAVALTFDDGPDPQYTPQLLDVLRQYGVQATFSMIGSRVRDYPDVVRRVVGEGHNLSNHSWQHLMDLGQRPGPYQYHDLWATLGWFHSAVPDAPIKYFRAPGGNFTPGLVQVANSLGMSSLYWDVDPRDWDAATYGHGQPMVDHIVSVVKHTTRPGSIILSHDRVRPDTIAAYKILLPWLNDHFRITRLP
jgi:peptidoglycan/xylan/chitin deacetylase (PgdA/CDA1 family)